MTLTLTAMALSCSTWIIKWVYIYQINTLSWASGAFEKGGYLDKDIVYQAAQNVWIEGAKAL